MCRLAQLFSLTINKGKCEDQACGVSDPFTPRLNSTETQLQATPQGLDQKSKMEEEVMSKIARRRS